MKDKNGKQIYKGDVVTIHSPANHRKSPTYDLTGTVKDVKSIKTGYGEGGWVYIHCNHFTMVGRESKYITRLSDEEAMLWKLENS